MDEAVLEKGEESMTNQQFDAVIKMVLSIYDSNKANPELARKMVANLIIDTNARKEYEKPLNENDGDKG
ncbi:MAG: hypothetical protein FWF44_06240 [Defluviitaleaceae bacterium]|nr:hypothetical protein [Defluviitaleaceae bacterium]